MSVMIIITLFAGAPFTVFVSSQWGSSLCFVDRVVLVGRCHGFNVRCVFCVLCVLWI